LFEDASVKYEDTRIVRADWIGGVKEDYIKKGIALFGQIPVLSIGDVHMAQTGAILRYLAKQHGYYGKTPQEQFVCDMVYDGADDWRSAYVDIVYPADRDQFPALKDQFVKTKLVSFLNQFNTLLKRVEGGQHFFVGKEITFADFAVFEMLDISLPLDANCLKGYPLLVAFHERIASRPHIAAYIQSGRRPVKINNSGLGQ